MCVEREILLKRWYNSMFQTWRSYSCNSCIHYCCGRRRNKSRHCGKIRSKTNRQSRNRRRRTKKGNWYVSENLYDLLILVVVRLLYSVWRIWICGCTLHLVKEQFQRSLCEKRPCPLSALECDNSCLNQFEQIWFREAVFNIKRWIKFQKRIR
jgi:hypothetical protein